MKATVCSRCQTPVVFDNVSSGYYAVCPNHDEDLYEFETRTLDSLTLVTCNWCEMKDDDMDIKECPNCHTDEYLMELTKG